MFSKNRDYKAKYRQTLNLPLNLSAQAYFICQLINQRTDSQLVWNLTNTRYLESAQKLLTFFAKVIKIRLSIFLFPQDWLDWQAQPADTATVLLVADEHWTLALADPKTISANIINLAVAQTIKPQQLKARLLAAGYEPGPLPDGGGWFYQQGGILFITDNHATWRIIWQGNKIESIRRYNFYTENDDALVNKITLAPRQLTPLADFSLADYLRANYIIVNAPAAIKTNHAITCRPTAGSPLRGVPTLTQQWPLINDYIARQISRGYGVKILSTEIPFIKTWLAPLAPAIDWQAISDRLAYELEGFTDDISRMIYLTDRELIGRRRRRFATNLASYEKLKTGDYVVHIDHGIGRFNSLINQTIDGQVRDYLLVDYADNDKLYVPVEHTDRLSRYRGGPHPILQRLHSASWFKITKKVKAETAALANELIKIQAARKITSTKPMSAYPEEYILAASFPWPLTSDQLKAWSDITADLSRPQPMERLICGDVGFGKTELAIRAAYRAVLNGYQVALLAPTTLLAQQHYDTFSDRLNHAALTIGLITRRQTGPEQTSLLTQLAQGRTDIIIGTHALLAARVEFARLGLLIIDEEQRFGVKQKEKLKQYKPSVHVLTLSATPIPRTLNLAVSSLRDLSIIMTPPVGRQPITTTIAVFNNNLIKQAITAEIKRRGQVYYLVNHIADLPAVAQRLKNLIKGLKLGIVHGRMAGGQAEQVMRDFDNNQLDLLLATSIIENGLDLPNVNTLIVEHAEKFGLADLYQLKGRVGRGTAKAYAYFLVPERLPELGHQRLQALRAAADLGSGLSLAFKDMELRGAGAILGRAQHGQINAVGVHLYGQLLAQAVEELKTGQALPGVPEVLLRLPLAGRLSEQLIPNEFNRIQIYQRLASQRDTSELKHLAEELIGRPLNDTAPDRQLKNLLTLLEIKILSERSGLREVACQTQNQLGRFSIRFINPVLPAQAAKLYELGWHPVESSWQARQPLAAGAWIEWLKQSLIMLGN